jgi:hypothetical protein
MAAALRIVNGSSDSFRQGEPVLAVSVIVHIL